MYRSSLASPIYSPQGQESRARLLSPLTLWISVSLIIRYGFYGNYHVLLGPNSSRLIKTSSIFVDQIQVTDYAKKGIFLYGFSEKPNLSLETNWNVSNYLIIGAYNRQGFSLWLNKGSRIHVSLKVQTSSLNNLLVVLIKGEQNFETLSPIPSNSSDVLALIDPLNGHQKSNYIIEEDEIYYLGVMNMNPRSVIMEMNVTVSSVIYDTSSARSICSTINGFCRLKLLFPNTQFFVLTTPNNGDLGEWYIELSFVARLLTYVAVLGSVVLVIFLFFKYLGACDTENITEEEEVQRETDPLMPQKAIGFTYGTGEEDTESGICSSSGDLYDGKICVICYDEQRNCFFVPCGHCAACYECAQRILDGENKACPICRRLIHKIRRLFCS